MPGLDQRRHFWISDSGTADLSGSPDVAFHQRGRDIQNLGHVVEAMTGIVSRKKRGCVDVEVEKIPNRVGVLGSVQTVESGATRIRIQSCRLIESCLERRHKSSER